MYLDIECLVQMFHFCQVQVEFTSNEFNTAGDWRLNLFSLFQVFTWANMLNLCHKFDCCHCDTYTTRQKCSTDSNFEFLPYVMKWPHYTNKRALVFVQKHTTWRLGEGLNAREIQLNYSEFSQTSGEHQLNCNRFQTLEKLIKWGETFFKSVWSAISCFMYFT